MDKLYNGIKELVNKIIKIRQQYKLAVKIKNIVIKVLNLGATGYTLFTTVEPFLNKNKDKDKTEVLDIK